MEGVKPVANVHFYGYFSPITKTSETKNERDTIAAILYIISVYKMHM